MYKQKNMIIILSILLLISIIINILIVNNYEEEVLIHKIQKNKMNINYLTEKSNCLTYKTKYLSLLIKLLDHDYKIVTATMYNAHPNQTDCSPFITADGTDLRKINYKSIAISWDLHKRYGGEYKFGDKVLILNAENKSGIYIVNDLMNKRFKNYIDILEPYNEQKYKLGNVILINLTEGI